MSADSPTPNALAATSDHESDASLAAFSPSEDASLAPAVQRILQDFLRAAHREPMKQAELDRIASELISAWDDQQKAPSCG